MAKTYPSEVIEYVKENYKGVKGEAARELLKKYPQWFDNFEQARNLVRRICKNKPQGDKNTWEFQEDSAYYEYSGYKSIRTLDEALKFCKADLDIWEVDRYVFNSWDVTMKDANFKPKTATNYQVKVWFKKREEGWKEAFENLASTLDNVNLPIYTPRLQNGVLLEIDIFDPHFGKYAIQQETNDPYNVEIAEQRYSDCMGKILDRAKNYPIEKILYPIGNDWFHCDTWNNSTTKGTPQDTNLRWWEQWDKGVDIAIKNILRLSQIAPVHVMMVLSNHDWQNVYKMGSLLRRVFESNQHITIDDRPISRKYFKWGRVGLGFCHGNEEKHSDLPIIILRENKDWQDVDVIEWHLGHFHKKKELRVNVANEDHGIMIRLMRSISSADFWHYKNGYIGGIKGAEGYLWDKKEGNVGIIPATL